jgi:hypothetical protein
MSNKEYQGEPIDASWQSDLRDAQKTDGETIAASDDGESGKMSTSDWPSALPEEQFDKGKSSGADQQSRIIRQLVQHPNASAKRIVDLADGRVPAYVRSVRHKASVFATPDEVPFDIPERPDPEQTLLKGQLSRLLEHPDARFDASDFGLDASESVQSQEEAESEPAAAGVDVDDQTDGSEVCRRYYVEGKDAKTVATELGLSPQQVTGYCSAWYNTDHHEHAEMGAWPIDLPENGLSKAQTEAFEYWLRNPEAEKSEVASAVDTTPRTVGRVRHRIKCYTDDGSALPFDLPAVPADTTPDFALEAYRERTGFEPDVDSDTTEGGEEPTESPNTDSETENGNNNSDSAATETQLRALSKNVQDLDAAASDRLRAIEERIEIIERRQEASLWTRLKWWFTGGAADPDQVINNE